MELLSKKQLQSMFDVSGTTINRWVYDEKYAWLPKPRYLVKGGMAYWNADEIKERVEQRWNDSDSQ